MSAVRIVGGIHDGLIGEHVDDEGDTAVVEFETGAGVGIVRVPRKFVKPLAPIAELFDDPEAEEEEED